MKNIAKNVFNLLLKEEKSLLIKKSRQIKEKAGNYITIPYRRRKPENNRKARKRKNCSKIFFMTRPSFDKDKPNSTKKINSKKIIFDNKARSKLRDKFEIIDSLKICNILIDFLYIFSYLIFSSKITNTIILKLLNIYLFFDFEILFWSINLKI